MNNCLRRILQIRWPNSISNRGMWEKTHQLDAGDEIRRRQCGWIDHTLRKPASNITRQVLTCNPQGKRKRRRPRNTRRRNFLTNTKRTGYSCKELEKRLGQKTLEDCCQRPMSQEGRRVKESVLKLIEI